MTPAPLPRVLVVDDRFGRQLPDRRNDDRAALCAQFLLADVTGDEDGKGPGPRVLRPVAEAVFHRGQTPAAAGPGDVVRNAPEEVLWAVAAGWENLRPGQPRWALLLLDLCFLTGEVPAECEAGNAGLPEGTPADRDPRGYFGLQLLAALQKRFPDLPVVVFSAEDREVASSEFSLSGARAFLPRTGRDGPTRLVEYLNRYGLSPDPSGQIVGQSVALLRILREARRAAATDWPVLIRGELGTGKELFARFVHDHSRRAGGPYLPVSLPAIPRDLVEDTLFGHEKGAYSGATDARGGKFVAATGGTLFLDEVGDTPPETQVKLLRVLETGVVDRVGADAPVQTDARVIAATNEDVEGRAATGRFRPELLDRLRTGGTLFLPPLRERPEDIPLLAEHFVRLAERMNGGALRRKIHPDAVARLVAYHWPGNVRELRNCLFTAVREYPDVEHLVPLHLSLPPAAPGAAAGGAPPAEPARRRRTTDEVVALLDGIEFDERDEASWAGKMPALGDAVTLLLLRQLRAALLATRGRRTADAPQGRVQIHPAVRILTGDDTLTATQAADLVKRLLKGASARVGAAVEADPVLAEAVATARGLRRRGRRRPPTDEVE